MRFSSGPNEMKFYHFLYCFSCQIRSQSVSSELLYWHLFLDFRVILIFGSHFLSFIVCFSVRPFVRQIINIVHVVPLSYIITSLVVCRLSIRSSHRPTVSRAVPASAVTKAVYPETEAARQYINRSRILSSKFKT